MLHILESGNHAPIFLSINETQLINETDLFWLQVHAYDLDNDPLEYSLETPPQGMLIDPATGAITWVPTWAQVGTHVITVVANDGNTTGHLSFPITVRDINDPPDSW